MRFSTVTMLGAVAGLVAAQSSTTSAAMSTSSCAAQVVLDTCVSQQKAQLAHCQGNDWDCLCNNWTNIQVCYNNCPNDPGAFSASQSKVQYCNAASLYGSSAAASKTKSATASVSSALSSALASASSTAASVSSALASASSSAAASSVSSSASSASASATTAKTGAAVANKVVPAGRVLALVVGAAVLL